MNGYAQLGYCGQTVRDLLRAFTARGTDALYPFRSGPAPDLAHRARVADELKRMLAEDRTWTSRQLSRALAEHGISLGPRQVRRHLRRIKAGYRRTASSLKHKQDPAKAERAGRVLENLKAKADWPCITSTSVASPRHCLSATVGRCRSSGS